MDSSPEPAKNQAEITLGARVRILVPLCYGSAQTDMVYRHLPARLWPWHVRPDNWGIHRAGIALAETEIEVLV